MPAPHCSRLVRPQHICPARQWHSRMFFRGRCTATSAASSRTRKVSVTAQMSVGQGSSKPADAGRSFARQAAAGLASASLAATLLAAPVDAADLQQLLPPPSSQHSIALRPAQAAAQQHAAAAAAADLCLADLSLPRVDDLPRVNNPWQILGYLLKHPVAALLVGGGLAIAVPRLVRAGIRFVIVPAAVLLLLYVAARNPGFVWGGVSGAVSAATAHPVATSAVILVASSLLLSPYILLAGIAVVLVTGTKILPSFMRPALPGPVSEALHQVDILQGQTRSALDQLGAAVRPAPALKDGRK